MDAPRLFGFDNSYGKLPPHFYCKLPPTPVAAPELLLLNDALAGFLGLSAAELRGPDGVAVLAGNRVPEGADPLAMAYAGHQFGHWSPRLGDGRAILLGEIRGRDGLRRDIQLKGSGPTPYSRSGDGRAALGPVLREYLVSEAMDALGIPTTRALAVVASGEAVQRERPLPGAVLTRVAQSHIRVGTFQYIASRKDHDGLKQLADHLIARSYPALAEAGNPYPALLLEIVRKQADLVAGWMLVGFIHGVMNTDNMSASGETIDYGPCAFMDWFDPRTVYSSIDQGGRYAFGNQPRIAHWNLSCLAQAMLPLLGATEEEGFAHARQSLDAFPDLYNRSWSAGLAAKLGLARAGENAGDDELGSDLLHRMAAQSADFTLTFRGLSALDAGGPGAADEPVRALFKDPARFDEWAIRWRERIALDARPDTARQAAMRSVNPARIARNHLVEEALEAAVERGDMAPYMVLLDLLRRPFEARDGAGDGAMDGDERYARPPEPDEIVTATFCGT